MKDPAPAELHPKTLAMAAIGALSCACVLFFAPTSTAVGTFERFGLQITSIIGLLAIGFYLGMAGRG